MSMGQACNMEWLVTHLNDTLKSQQRRVDLLAFCGTLASL